MDPGERPDLSRLAIPPEARSRASGPLGCACRTLALVLLAGAAVVGYLEARHRGLLPADQPPPPPASSEPVAVTPPPELRDPSRGRAIMPPVIGYVIARRKAAVAAARAGKIVELTVDEGSAVQAGQLIARLDDAIARAELERVKARIPAVNAEVARAKAQLPSVEAELGRADAVVAEAQRELERRERLVREKLAPEEQLVPARSRLEVVKAERAKVKTQFALIEAQVAEAASKLATIQAEIRVAEENLAQHEVRAPFAGIVIAKHAEIGETTGAVAVPQGLGAGSAIVTIADLTVPEVEADVPESRVAELQPEQPAEVELDAVSGTRFKGSLRLILPSADRRKATVPVRVAIHGPVPRLRPDMSARVTFVANDEQLARVEPPPARDLAHALRARLEPAATAEPVKTEEGYAELRAAAIAKARAEWEERGTTWIGLGVVGLALFLGGRMALAARARRPAPSVARQAPVESGSESGSTSSASRQESGAGSSSDAPTPARTREPVSSGPTPVHAWSTSSSGEREDTEELELPKRSRPARASFRVLAQDSISDVESIEEIFVVDDMEETSEDGIVIAESGRIATPALGDRRVYALGDEGKIVRDAWLLRSFRVEKGRSVLDLDGAPIAFGVESDAGARVFPSSEARVAIEGVKVAKAGVPLVHGMVFTVDDRPYLYMDRAANEAERRRTYVAPTMEASTPIADKVIDARGPKKPARVPAPSEVFEASDASASDASGSADAPARESAPPLPKGKAPIVEIRGLEKTYRRGSAEVRVLCGLDLDVPEGDFLALMGPSGSGKSTLLNIIAGIDRPTGGSIRIAGQEIANLDEAVLTQWRARAVGFIFQFYNLVPVLTALENVELPLLLTDLSRSERRKRAKHALELVGLGERYGHLPRELSGGQEQRVAIARALVTDPALLVADEPTGDLDSENAEAILDLLVRLNREMGKTIVMVTHDPRAAQAARRTIRLEKGVLEREE